MITELQASCEPDAIAKRGSEATELCKCDISFVTSPSTEPGDAFE
jgi:hypothetical protein